MIPGICPPWRFVCADYRTILFKIVLARLMLSAIAACAVVA
jgi:hypothetical protein